MILLWTNTCKKLLKENDILKNECSSLSEKIWWKWTVKKLKSSSTTSTKSLNLENKFIKNREMWLEANYWRTHWRKKKPWIYAWLAKSIFNKGVGYNMNSNIT